MTNANRAVSDTSPFFRLVSVSAGYSTFRRCKSDASITKKVSVLPIAVGVIVTLWSRRPGWGDRQILALAAGALFAYAWHAFVSLPAFDSAPIVIVRISNVLFAALALVAVWVAARRISDLSASQSAMAR
jgi:hypothetical protein